MKCSIVELSRISSFINLRCGKFCYLQGSSIIQNVDWNVLKTNAAGNSGVNRSTFCRDSWIQFSRCSALLSWEQAQWRSKMASYKVQMTDFVSLGKASHFRCSPNFSDCSPKFARSFHLDLSPTYVSFHHFWPEAAKVLSISCWTMAGQYAIDIKT